MIPGPPPVQTTNRRSSSSSCLDHSVTRRATIVAGLRDLGASGACWNAGIEAYNPVQEVEHWLRHTRGEVDVARVVLTLHNNDYSFTPVGLYTDSGFAICRPGELAEFSLPYPDIAT